MCNLHIGLTLLNWNVKTYIFVHMQSPVLHFYDGPQTIRAPGNSILPPSRLCEGKSLTIGKNIVCTLLSTVIQFYICHSHHPSTFRRRAIDEQTPIIKSKNTFTVIFYPTRRYHKRSLCGFVTITFIM